MVTLVLCGCNSPVRRRKTMRLSRALSDLVHYTKSVRVHDIETQGERSSKATSNIFINLSMVLHLWITLWMIVYSCRFLVWQHWPIVGRCHPSTRLSWIRSYSCSHWSWSVLTSGNFSGSTHPTTEWTPVTSTLSSTGTQDVIWVRVFWTTMLPTLRQQKCYCSSCWLLYVVPP